MNKIEIDRDKTGATKMETDEPPFDVTPKPEMPDETRALMVWSGTKKQRERAIRKLAEKLGMARNSGHRRVGERLVEVMGWKPGWRGALKRYLIERPDLPENMAPVAQVPKPAKLKTTRVWQEANSDAFLASYEWRRTRMQVLKRDGARCACCGATPADGVRMHVDHIKPRRLFPALALELSNLQVLCEACNHGKGNWDMTDWRAKEPA